MINLRGYCVSFLDFKLKLILNLLNFNIIIDASIKRLELF